MMILKAVSDKFYSQVTSRQTGEILNYTTSSSLKVSFWIFPMSLGLYGIHHLDFAVLQVQPDRHRMLLLPNSKELWNQSEESMYLIMCLFGAELGRGICSFLFPTLEMQFDTY